MEVDYDKLSAQGEEQSRRLGQYWVRHRIVFDRVFHGPAKRHIRTMEIACEQVMKAGLPWPDPQPIPEFDEFDAFTMMKRMVPVLIPKSPETARLNEVFLQAQHTPEAGRHLQKLFEEVARHWSTGEFDAPDHETWSQFRARIASAVESVRTSAAPSSHTVVFTSGGPIAATIGHTLGLDAARTMEFVWISRNCSWSQFLFSGSRLSLHSLNAVPHLDDLSLLTYR